MGECHFLGYERVRPFWDYISDRASDDEDDEDEGAVGDAGNFCLSAANLLDA